MIVCYCCRTLFGSVKQLFNHLKIQHGLAGRYGLYRCGQSQCGRSFHDRYTFSRHIMNNHADDIDASHANCEPISDYANTANNDIDDFMDIDLQDEQIDYESEDVDNIEQLAAEFISKFKRASTSLNLIDDVISSCSLFVDSVISSLHRQVTSILKKVKCENINFKELTEIFEQHKQPFKTLDSQYKQNKYWINHGCLIQPVEYSIGSRACYKTDKSGIVVPDAENVTGQYVPLQMMLQAYLSDNHKAHLATNYMTDRTDVIQTFFDGNRWKHQAVGENVLVLRFYGDDFEPGNPLGSHKGLYKIGCIYYQCEGMPTEVLSKTENSLLALCYYANDVKEFGWERVLQPLLTDLIRLENFCLNDV